MAWSLFSIMFALNPKVNKFDQKDTPFLCVLSSEKHYLNFLRNNLLSERKIRRRHILKVFLIINRQNITLHNLYKIGWESLSTNKMQESPYTIQTVPVIFNIILLFLAPYCVLQAIHLVICFTLSNLSIMNAPYA